MIVNITPAGVIESTIMYGIVRGIWWGIHQLKTDTGKVIDKHVEDGHHMRLTKCYTDACAKFRSETGLGSLRREE